MNVHKFTDLTGAVVCWDSKRSPRAGVEAAFEAVGFRHLVPAVNRLAAINDAAKAVAAEAGLDGPAQPTLKRFTLDRSTVGVGVYHEIRGVEENEYRFLFSCGVHEDTGRAIIVREAVPLPASCHDLCRDVYREGTGFLPASDVTRALNGLIRKSHGVGIRENGSVYFVPGEFLATYHTLADAIEPAGPVLHTWKVPLESNPRLVETVSDAMVEEIVKRMEQRAADWKALVESEGKPQKRGLESRFRELCDDASQVEYYESFFGRQYDRLRAALEAQQAMIGLAHLDLWNAEEAA